MITTYAVPMGQVRIAVVNALSCSCFNRVAPLSSRYGLGRVIVQVSLCGESSMDAVTYLTTPTQKR